MIIHYRQVQQHIHDQAVACGRLPAEITLVAVTKNQPLEALWAAYWEGCRDFGESRVQAALQKRPLMPADCRCHLIGTLQSNKVAKALSVFDCIQAVDHPRLAEKISATSGAQGKVTPVFLQVNTSGEPSKHGLCPKEWDSHLFGMGKLEGIRIDGLMTMAPYTPEQAPIRACFRQLYAWREIWRARLGDPALLRHLSMGMSHDYLIAIQEGATILRIGTAIFG